MVECNRPTWWEVIRTEPGTIRSAFEFVRSAPWIVLFVYAIPALFLLIAVLSLIAASILILITVARMGGGLVRWVVISLAVTSAGVVAAVVSYWILAGLYALGSMGRRGKAGSGTALQPAAREREGDEGPEPALIIPYDGSRTTDGAPGDRSEFRFSKIGIVLSGGGAKGVYQAGALKAIHEFLAAHNAVDAVVSVAGTSIGSWNTLFWIGDLVAGQGGRSVHEQWWTGFRLSDLVRPAATVVPGLSSHLMSNAPWRREFDRLFADEGAIGRPALLEQMAAEEPRGRRRIHFYLSRTNVLPGRLAFDTNNREAVDATNRPTHDLDLARIVSSFERLGEAVFTSMAIPPLFPYARVNDPTGSEWCEDGGVIDNLPIRLGTAFDECDLLFVLPLNSSFNEADRPRNLAARLSRVIDVRQGVLERLALKNVYLFNMRSALSEGQPVPAFVIAPGQPLRIHTTELWRSRDLRQAVFDQMYCATRQALEEFFAPERVARFFEAYEEFGRSGGKRLPRGGFIGMSVVDPAWHLGAPFEVEHRF